MKTIVCFGDSNTFGVNPDGGRFPRQIRWTGRLQTLLGEEYYVVEEGLNGRTTVWEDPMQPCRCGMEALPYILKTHKPIDVMLIMLGTNDCKAHFHASARSIGRGLDSLCQRVLASDDEGYPAPGLFLVAPIYIGEGIGANALSSYDETAPAKSRELASYYRKVAEAYHAGFLDAAAVASPGSDLLHMDAASHEALAQALAGELRKWFDGKGSEAGR